MFLLAPFQFDFMWRALIGSVAVGVLAALLGVFVVLRGMSFIGEGLAHGSLGGLALAYALGWNLYAFGSVYTVGLALLIAWIGRRRRTRMDTAVGIVFSGSLALGVLLISTIKWYTTDLSAYLFGDVLALRTQDLVAVMVVLFLVTGFMLLFYRRMVFLSFDPEGAQATGLPTTWLNNAFLALIGIGVVAAMQTVGVILVTALLVIPAATAWQVARSMVQMTAIAVVVAMVSALVGLYASYYLNVASGASIVLAAAFIYGLVSLVSGRRVGWRRSLGMGARG
ncbi:metal ABC transporter permease [Kyrpidia spormannii]|uniref:Manganese ABC transporter permease n=1 Tax=Kyrpidia spormannii TaxID=2055160 RepID=A0A6F9EEH0_9BACL|nr:metal ABC transporter permease [Kyrpidia spormannii]CAB3394821.1 Manganese ABC transporter permease [Kyrpidia spormannii]